MGCSTSNMPTSRPFRSNARSPQKVDPKPPKPVTRVHAIKERILPLDERVADAADEAELDEIYDTERRLCTSPAPAPGSICC